MRNDTTQHKCDILASYNSRRSLTNDKLFLLLHVDDDAIIFRNMSVAILGLKIAFLQMERIGLNIHFGIGDKTSKTQAMFL